MTTEPPNRRFTNNRVSLGVLDSDRNLMNMLRYVDLLRSNCDKVFGCFFLLSFSLLQSINQLHKKETSLNRYSEKEYLIKSMEWKCLSNQRNICKYFTLIFHFYHFFCFGHWRVRLYSVKSSSHCILHISFL